jgi:hypothetical protein
VILQYVLMYVVNFVMLIPLVLLAADYWEDTREDGKPRAQKLLIRYIQIITCVALGIWLLGQVASLFAWGGGDLPALAFIAVTLTIVVIMLASLLYARLLEKGEETNANRKD